MEKPLHSQSYYEILNVSKDATDQEIKTSYHQKVKQYHPDHNHGREKECADYFKKVLDAYRTLSDPKLRANYDRAEILKPHIITSNTKPEIEKILRENGLVEQVIIPPYPRAHPVEINPDLIHSIYNNLNNNSNNNLNNLNNLNNQSGSSNYFNSSFTSSLSSSSLSSIGEKTGLGINLPHFKIQRTQSGNNNSKLNEKDEKVLKDFISLVNSSSTRQQNNKNPINYNYQNINQDDENSNANKQHHHHHNHHHFHNIDHSGGENGKDNQNKHHHHVHSRPHNNHNNIHNNNNHNNGPNINVQSFNQNILNFNAGSVNNNIINNNPPNNNNNNNNGYNYNDNTKNFNINNQESDDKKSEEEKEEKEEKEVSSTSSTYQGMTLQTTIAVSFEESVYGCTKHILFKRQVLCTICSGKDKQKNPMSTEKSLQQNEQKYCSNCEGKGVRMEDAKVAVKVPAGVCDGWRKVMVGEGDQSKSSIGDLVIIFNVEKSSFFNRLEGKDEVLCDLPITFSQAALGVSLKVPSIYGPIRVCLLIQISNNYYEYFILIIFNHFK